MQKRNYNQACSLAVALDLLGERWTWLIVRALLTGPKRYGELLGQLPGIGTNLLAERLRHMCRVGVTEKSGAGRQAAYRLTEIGEDLRPITHELIRWGRNFSGEIAEGAVSSPQWDMLAIEAAFIPENATGIDAVLELALSGFTFHLVIRKEQCRAIDGPAISPDVRVISDSATLLAVGRKETTVRQAEQAGQLEIEGSRDAFGLLFECFDAP